MDKRKYNNVEIFGMIIINGIENGYSGRSSGGENGQVSSEIRLFYQ